MISVCNDDTHIHTIIVTASDLSTFTSYPYLISKRIPIPMSNSSVSFSPSLSVGQRVLNIFSSSNPFLTVKKTPSTHIPLDFTLTICVALSSLIYIVIALFLNSQSPTQTVISSYSEFTSLSNPVFLLSVRDGDSVGMTWNYEGTQCENHLNKRFQLSGRDDGIIENPDDPFGLDVFLPKTLREISESANFPSSPSFTIPNGNSPYSIPDFTAVPLCFLERQEYVTLSSSYTQNDSLSFVSSQLQTLYPLSLNFNRSRYVTSNAKLTVSVVGWDFLDFILTEDVMGLREDLQRTDTYITLSPLIIEGKDEMTNDIIDKELAIRALSEDFEYGDRLRKFNSTKYSLSNQISVFRSVVTSVLSIPSPIISRHWARVFFRLTPVFQQIEVHSTAIAWWNVIAASFGVMGFILTVFQVGRNWWVDRQNNNKTQNKKNKTDDDSDSFLPSSKSSLTSPLISSGDSPSSISLDSASSEVPPSSSWSAAVPSSVPWSSSMVKTPQFHQFAINGNPQNTQWETHGEGEEEESNSKGKGNGK